MAKLKFKKKCKYCKLEWVLAEAKMPIICDKCKRKFARADKEKD